MTQKPELVTHTPEKINFATEAVVKHWISKDAQGKYIDMKTGEDRNEVVKRFSLVKYGHLPSIRDCADEMALEAIDNPYFLTLTTESSKTGKTIFITSPGIYNVPSASNILLAETARQINMAAVQKGFLALKVAEQTRLGESSLNYAQMEIGARQKDQATRSVIPEMFANSPVIYLDDVYISGTVAERAKQRLLNEAHASHAFFLFSMKVDPRLVAQSNGKIENELNRLVVDGSLESLKRVLLDEFIPTQKTLVDFFDPKNGEGFEAFIRDELPISVALKLYVAQAQNDFQRRWQGIYSPAIRTLEHFLLEKKIIDQNGLATRGRKND